MTPPVDVNTTGGGGRNAEGSPASGRGPSGSGGGGTADETDAGGGGCGGWGGGACPPHERVHATVHVASATDAFSAYPLVRMPVNAEVLALCALLLVLALAPFADRRGIEP